MACPWCLPRQRFRFPLRMSQESIPLLCAANADSLQAAAVTSMASRLVEPAA